MQVGIQNVHELQVNKKVCEELLDIAKSHCLV